VVVVTGRRLRESPGVLAAGVLLAGLLILIGILVASTAATGTTHTQTVTTARPAGADAVVARRSAALTRLSAAQAGALRSEQTTIVKLLASLGAQAGRLSSATASLRAARANARAARANARCWHAKVMHPIKTRRLHCAPPSPATT